MKSLIPICFIIFNACALLPTKDEAPQSYSGLYSAIQQGDVSLGMSREQVQKAWGHPSQVWTAGATQSGNEKWVYAESPHFRHGVGRARILYFEGGQLAGWKSDQDSDSLSGSQSSVRSKPEDNSWY